MIGYVPHPGQVSFRPSAQGLAFCLSCSASDDRMHLENIPLSSYPPSPVHVVALLSQLRPCDETATVVEPTHYKALLDAVPSLLVLHELSGYFLSESQDDQ